MAAPRSGKALIGTTVWLRHDRAGRYADAIPNADTELVVTDYHEKIYTVRLPDGRLYPLIRESVALVPPDEQRRIDRAWGSSC
jgi:hypothetical protein